MSLVQIDKNRALNLFASGDGGLHQKDLYSFCMTQNGLIIGHLTLEGLNVLKFEDSKGKVVGQGMIDVAKYGNVNEEDFMIARLTTDDEKLYKKTRLVTRAADLVCVVGFYSQ